MALFKSTLTDSNIMYQALEAFNLDFETDVSITSEVWGGVMVTVLVGEHKGVYDYHANGKLFIAA